MRLDVPMTSFSRPSFEYASFSGFPGTGGVFEAAGLSDDLKHLNRLTQLRFFARS